MRAHRRVLTYARLNNTWEICPPNPCADDSAASGVPGVWKGLPQEARRLALAVRLLCGLGWKPAPLRAPVSPL